MADTIASMKASIVIDKNDLTAQILKLLSDGQKELSKNRLELLFDINNEDTYKKFKKILDNYQKELSNADMKIRIDDSDVQESFKSVTEFVNNVEKLINGHNLKLDVSINAEKQQKQIRALENEIAELCGRLGEYENIIDRLNDELIELESHQGGGGIFGDAKSLDRVSNALQNIESNMTKISKIFVDVGDGDEFSPLLNTINKVTDSIRELQASTKNIKFNMNVEVGSSSELDAKFQEKVAVALQAYQRLFNQIKMSGAGGSVINQKFFDFDLNQFDTTYSKLQGIANFIATMRKEAKEATNGYDVLRKDIENSYWTKASSAMGRVTSVKNEIKSDGNTDQLNELFGKTDLSEVIGQLTVISTQLEDMVSIAQDFANVFKDGLNVNTSVEEISKLTDRVHELESELDKLQATASVPEADVTANTNSSAVNDLKNVTDQAEKAKQSVREVRSELDFLGSDTNSQSKNEIGQFDIKSTMASIEDNFGDIEPSIKAEIESILTNVENETYNSLTQSILKLLTQSDQFISSLGFGDENTELRSYIRNSKIKYDSSYKDEFGDDWKKVNATLGMTSKSGDDIISVLSQANTELGTTFDLTVSNQEAVRQLYEIMSDRPNVSISDFPEDAATVMEELLRDAPKVQATMQDIESNISLGDTTSNAIDIQVKKQREYNDLVAVGYDRIQKMKKISESGTTGQNSVYDLLRLNHEAWDEVKANNFFNTIPEEGLKRYTKILEVVEKIVQEMVQASGLTEDQIVSQLKNIKSAQGGNFKLNGADSGWTHFATYSNGQKDSMQKPNGITYKVYAAFDDIKDLNQNVVASIMDALTKAGFKGRLKTTSGSTSFGDKLNGLAITDQMVVHGSTKKDQEIAYNTLKNMGLKLSYLGGGIDTPDGSFSQTLASGEINKYVQGLEKEATTARDTAKAEQELANARKESSSTVSQNPKKDAFPSVDGKLEEATSSAKELNKILEQVDIPIDSFDDVLAKLDLTHSELVDIVKITKQSISNMKGEFHDSYTLKDSRGSTEIYGENSKTDRGQLLRSNIVSYDTKKDEVGIAKQLLAVDKQLVQEEKELAAAQQETWKNFQKEQKIYDEIGNTDNLLSNLSTHELLNDQFFGLVDDVDKVNEKLKTGELTISEYRKQVKSLTTEYSKLVDIQQKRDVEEYKNQGKEQTKQHTETVQSLNNKLREYSQLMNSIARGKGFNQEKEEASQLREVIVSISNSDIITEKEKNEAINRLNKIEQQARGVQIGNLSSYINSKKGNLIRYNKVLENKDNQPKVGYTNALNDYAANINALENKISEINQKGLDLVTDGDVSEVNSLKVSLNKIEQTINGMKFTDKVSTAGERARLESMISEIDSFTRMTKQSREEFNRLVASFRSEGNELNINDALGQLKEFRSQLLKTGEAGKGFLDTIKDKAWYGWAAQLASMFSLYDVINLLKQASQTVVELNTNITELSKVSEASVKDIYNDFDSYADIAKKIGGTISDTISATADWSRNGYSLPDAKELAEVAQLYKNVGDGIDIDTANESLISTLRGFKLDADQAEHIVDVFNEVSNNEPISSAGIGESLQRSAASFYAANTSLEKAVALSTGTNSVLQDPEKVGCSNIADLYSNVMKIKVAISVNLLRRTRPSKDSYTF